jgi:hypothetical protein
MLTGFLSSLPTPTRLQQPIINATFYLNIIQLNSNWLIYKTLYMQIKHLYMYSWYQSTKPSFHPHLLYTSKMKRAYANNTRLYNKQEILIHFIQKTRRSILTYVITPNNPSKVKLTLHHVKLTLLKHCINKYSCFIHSNSSPQNSSEGRILYDTNKAMRF